MTIQTRNDLNEIFYQLQKTFMLFLLIEILIARIFYRVGMVFLSLDVYYAIYNIGSIARYIVVFLNFILLGLIIFRGGLDNLSKYLLIFVFSYFIASYTFYFLEFPFHAIYQVIGLVVIGFLINYLLIQTILRKKFAEYKLILIFLLVLVITFNLALIHQIFFTLDSLFEIPYAFHGFMFGIAQLMSVFLIAPLFFALPFLFREKIKLRGFFKKIPIIIILVVVIIIIGFINSPMQIITTDDQHIILPTDLFAWMVIYILGYTEIQGSLFVINSSAIALGLIALGGYFLWILGKSKKNQTMKQYSYGIFVIFCTAFLFIEASDSYFLMILLNGFLILTWRYPEV
ncbi:hypothetical protein LCGC14_1018880 [marine sediment metagenome]|uniref:Uncharacterized protein n=1 Tax=marine sediment metagenome TaxID=412755 RepID=A0A0F9QG78_9ZZZZ